MSAPTLVASSGSDDDDGSEVEVLDADGPLSEEQQRELAHLHERALARAQASAKRKKGRRKGRRDAGGEGERKKEGDDEQKEKQQQQQQKGRGGKKRKLSAKEEAAALRRADEAVTGHVIYVGHVPWGFFEPQMRNFFSQFGVVTKLRLARSHRTGNSKGYAFVEFEDEEAADVVAESMNGYLLFGKTLVCARVPPDDVHPDTFRGHATPHKRLPWREIDKMRHNKKRTPEQAKRRNDRLLRSDKRRRARLAELGIDYEYDGYGDDKEGVAAPVEEEEAVGEEAGAEEEEEEGPAKKKKKKEDEDEVGEKAEQKSKKKKKKKKKNK